MNRRLSYYAIGCIVISTLVLIAGIIVTKSYPRSSGDVRFLFPPSSETLDNYQQLDDLFGQTMGEAILVSLGEIANDPDSTAAEDRADRISELEEALWDTEHVSQVTSPLAAFSDLVPPIRLISPNGEFGRFVIEIDGNLDASEKKSLDLTLNNLMEQFPELQPTRAGSFFISQSVARYINGETQRLVPICLVALLILLSMFFCSPIMGFVVLVAPLLALVWTVLVWALLGKTFGPISQLMPPFVLAVGASYSVHVAVRLLAESHERSRVMRELTHSISLAAFTTIAGLLSLILLQVSGVTQFAVTASIGTLFAAILALVLTKAIVDLVTKDFSCLADLFSYLSNPDRWIRRRYVYGILLLTVVFASGIPRISINTNPSEFLPKSSSERIGLEKIDDVFPGNHAMSVVVRKGSPPTFEKLTPDDFSILRALEEDLLKIKGVYAIASGNDFYDLKKKADAKGLKKILVTDEQAREYGPIAVTTEDLTATRLLLDNDSGGTDLINLRDEIQSRITDFMLRKTQVSVNKFSFKLSSLSLLVAEQSRDIVYGILNSLLSTVLVVVILLVVTFKSVRILAVGLIPNIVPVVAIFGIIGYLYGELNLGSALVGAAALAIAVDNTFHLMITWRSVMAEDKLTGRASDVALRLSIRAFLTTGLVLSVSFGIMGLSPVLPLRQFGLLLTLTLAVGLVATIVLIPYFLRYLEEKIR